MTKPIAYVYNYLSFLFLDKKAKTFIKSVYLFGSGVRDELREDGDIDIFLSCESSNQSIVKNSVDRARALFYSSQDFLKWKHLGITQKLSIKVGVLEEWELKTSIQSEGIQLYGPPAISVYERGMIVTLELPEKHKRYVQATRALFGRKEKFFASKGIVEELGGKRLGKNTFIIPLSQRKQISDFLVKNKINYTLQEIGLPV